MSFPIEFFALQQFFSSKKQVLQFWSAHRRWMIPFPQFPMKNIYKNNAISTKNQLAISGIHGPKLIRSGVVWSWSGPREKLGSIEPDQERKNVKSGTNSDQDQLIFRKPGPEPTENNEQIFL